jgi:hypothetical protein
VRREQIIEVLRRALDPLAPVNAAWLGGSDAFGRADELSDVDLQVDVDDGYVAATFGAIEASLAAASPIVARLVMPMPTWHGHAQRFYRLRDTSEFTAVDVVVFERSDPRRYYNQTERHGSPLVLFDRIGVVGPVALDRGELGETLAGAVAAIHDRLPFTLPLVAKELRRGDALAALSAYHSYVLRPLVTLYRVRHTPARHQFGVRYTRDDLPADVQATLRELSFVADLEDLAAKLPRARRLLGELAASLLRSRPWEPGEASGGSS